MANTIYYHKKRTFVCELTLCAENLSLNVYKNFHECTHLFSFISSRLVPSYPNELEELLQLLFSFQLYAIFLVAL